MSRIEKSVPVFCCGRSRDKALKILKEKFPKVVISIDTGWGKERLEIEAEEEKLQEVIGFIKEQLDLILDYFVCLN